ncbi:MAG: hypothetical protein MUO63_04570 [Desulfobulbaceae bacterium]|nr:hypothetical protein [Desulfobulbaceae bacterium]
MIKISPLISILLVSLAFLSACTTERTISPTISGAPRTNLVVSPAILGSVYDGRTAQIPKDAAATLQTDLSRIYDSSIEWTDYFDKTPAGRVSVRIRIVTLGSSFGSRLVSSAAFANSVVSAQVSAIGPWGPVVGSVSSEQSVFAGSFSGEGWWNGAAWLDLEVQDNRGQRPITFTIPIVAEHRESNIYGYTSGDKAARAAWESVGVQLTRALDEIGRIVRDHQS